MRILEGVGTLIQLAGLVARLCKKVKAWSALSVSLTDMCPLEHEARAIQGVKVAYIL